MTDLENTITELNNQIEEYKKKEIQTADSIKKVTDLKQIKQ